MATARQLELLKQAQESLAKIKAGGVSGRDIDMSKLSKATTGLANKMIETGTPEQKLSAAKTQKKYLQTKQAQNKTLPETPTVQKIVPQTKTSDRVTNTMDLSNALNMAVAKARQARQSAELDFFDGVLPGGLEGGSISASTFGSLLGNLNRASTQFTQPLISDTLAAVEADRAYIQNEQNSIRDLALTLVEQGVGQEAIQGVLNSPDLNSAIAASAGVLQSTSKGDFEIRTIGNKLVKVDAEGNAQVIFGGGSSETSTPTDTPSVGIDTDFLDARMSDVKAKVKATFSQDFANRLITELTDEQLRLFMNDYIEASNQSKQSLNPEQYYLEWRSAAGLEEEETNSSKVTNPFG